MLHETALQQHADGNRMGLGVTLRRAAGILARLEEAEPAAVLSGAVSAHFPPSSSLVSNDEQMEIDEAQSLARYALGEAAYDAAFGRGAAMEDDEVVDYALREFRRLAGQRAQSDAQAPGSAPGLPRLSRRE